MISGTCPACTRPYTVSEITGFGILRARPASKGGPLMEFACPGCGHQIRLIPHGDGRYAPPGEPPPARASEADRRPPWMQDLDADTEQMPSEEAAEPTRGAAQTEAPRAEEIEIPVVPDTAPTLAEALELLGIEPTAEAEAIDRAYRERSRACHPDKVAHLDADFQALAEAKFKRLQAAYTLLRG